MTAVQDVEVEVITDQSQIWTHFSHLSYDDFGRAENLQVHKVARVIESARFYGLKTDVLSLTSRLSRQYGIFVFGIDYHFNPALWNMRRGQIFPYKVSLEVADVGQTSFTLFSQWVNKLDNQLLATSNCKLVSIDRTSRRPVTLPEWFRQKYLLILRRKQPLALPKNVPEVPGSAHKYDVTVAASDMDINGHTNQGNYVRFCCDASQIATSTGKLPGFHTDISRYPLKEMQVMYTGESAMGDRLQVFLWQEPDCAGNIIFVIKRPGDHHQPIVIFYARMVYIQTQLPLPRL